MSLNEKQQQQKEALCEQLKKTPIVQVTCEKTGVSRATYYRWRKEDKIFAKQADKALSEGVHLMNDMAESQLLSAIKSQNLTAIIFWLKHRHKSYTQKFEVTARMENPDLTEEQQALVQKALTLGSLMPAKKSSKK